MSYQGIARTPFLSLFLTVILFKSSKPPVSFSPRWLTNSSGSLLPSETSSNHRTNWSQSIPHRPSHSIGIQRHLMASLSQAKVVSKASFFLCAVIPQPASIQTNFFFSMCWIHFLLINCPPNFQNNGELWEQICFWLLFRDIGQYSASRYWTSKMQSNFSPM